METENKPKIEKTIVLNPSQLYPTHIHETKLVKRKSSMRLQLASTVCSTRDLMTMVMTIIRALASVKFKMFLNTKDGRISSESFHPCFHISQ